MDAREATGRKGMSVAEWYALDGDRYLQVIEGCDLWPLAELNIWYHALNCGFRTAFAGETDFPCLSDEHVGGGRS